MKIFLRFMLPVLLVLVAALLWSNSQQDKQIPDVAFEDMHGNDLQLADYRGQPLLMIFWATDCPGCINEMPDLIALHDRYASTGLAMLGVAMAHDRPEHINAMREAKQLPYTLTWDYDGKISEALGNVRVTPTHFLVDSQGEIIMRKIGELNMEQLEQRLNKMGLSPV